MVRFRAVRRLHRTAFHWTALVPQTHTGINITRVTLLEFRPPPEEYNILVTTGNTIANPRNWEMGHSIKAEFFTLGHANLICSLQSSGRTESWRPRSAKIGSCFFLSARADRKKQADRIKTNRPVFFLSAPREPESGLALKHSLRKC